jgi:2-oxoglutarate dehydrogenase E2 component (dihydrolipoamide succinyltransferase)
MSHEIVVPELGESVLEATVGRWLKDEGQQVEIGEPIVELETDKVNLEVGSEKAGVLKEIMREQGEDIQVGEVLAVIDPLSEQEQEKRADGQPSEEVQEQSKPQAELKITQKERKGEPDEEAERPKSRGDGRATPVAARYAHEKGIDLDQVKGTGPGDRITKADVEANLQTETEREAPDPDEAEGPAPADRRVERVRMSRRRRTIARRMVEAQHTTAMLTTFNEIDMSAVMDMRRRKNPELEAQHGVKLGITSFFVKAAVGALKQFPRLNAELDGEDLLLKRYYDIGIAVGAEEGLVVPVLRDVDRMSLVEIERQIESFVEKTRARTLKVQDLQGGTFSITNGGVFGSLLSTPILNPPQVGILGLHRIENRPVAVDEEVVVRPMMYVALSYDHRVVDGREAVQFLATVKDLVEDTEQLIIEA